MTTRFFLAPAFVPAVAPALAPALALALLAAACAPAPTYTSTGLKRGAATWGEIPRDARGEPVWAAIRPVPVPDAEVRPDVRPDIRPDGAAARPIPAADPE